MRAQKNTISSAVAATTPIPLASDAAVTAR